MTYTKKERERYNIHRDRICEELGIDKNCYNWLRRAGLELGIIDTHYCNGEIYNSENEYYAAVQDVYNKLLKKLKGSGLFYYHQSDPRGAAIYIDKHPIKDSDYTSSYCIY